MKSSNPISSAPSAQRMPHEEVEFTSKRLSDAFAAEVLRHLSAMPADEWTRLRTFGNNRSRFVNHDDAAMPDLTRETLVERFVSVDGMSIDDVLVPQYKAKAIEIAQIEGRAVFYVQSEGVYVMEELRGGPVPMTLSLWVTMPAYPPSW
jgi:hypothetical protein